MGLEIGPLYIRRSTLIDAIPGRVWEEFKSQERFSAWFGIGHTVEYYEPRVGGKIRLSADVGGEQRFFGGEILVFDENKELSFSENWEADGYAHDYFITIRLAQMFGYCHVEIFHHGLEQTPEIAIDELQGHEEGWHAQHLGTLKRIVEASQ